MLHVTKFQTLIIAGNRWSFLSLTDYLVFALYPPPYVPIETFWIIYSPTQWMVSAYFLKCSNQLHANTHKFVVFYSGCTAYRSIMHSNQEPMPVRLLLWLLPRRPLKRNCLQSANNYMDVIFYLHDHCIRPTPFHPCMHGYIIYACASDWIWQTCLPCSM